jgi:hypothetical protein
MKICKENNSFWFIQEIIAREMKESFRLRMTPSEIEYKNKQKK